MASISMTLSAAGMKAFLYPTTATLSLRCLIISSTSLARMAGGFSIHTCKPAPNA